MAVSSLLPLALLLLLKVLAGFAVPTSALDQSRAPFHIILLTTCNCQTYQ